MDLFNLIQPSLTFYGCFFGLHANFCFGMNQYSALERAHSDPAPSPLEYFGEMIDHCYDFAEAAKAAGRPIVGILCEFTPREIILAAGAVPVCLCGGSDEMIPPAEQFLPSNLCPLIKSTFGYHLTGRNPFLKWADLVVAETTCDGKKKMFELLGESKPMYVLSLPQKSADADAFEQWVCEIQKLRKDLETRFGVRITEDQLRQSAALMNRERGLRRKLAELMAQDCPPLTGLELIQFKSIISGIPTDLRQYEQALERFTTPPPSARRKDKIRVLLTGVPIVHGAERVLELIESNGGIVVCMENCTGLKPILEDVDLTEPEIIRAIAKKYYHLPCSVMTPNAGRLESLRALVKQYRPQCVVELVWQACLTYDIESVRTRRLAEEEFGLPYLKMTTDYSPADSTRLSTRLAALMETAASR
jgi:benzoyl-CoA reductase/2-hydroxyglutaryl-CoA dehydratase subunit BcrC/BadD/HgdB